MTTFTAFAIDPGKTNGWAYYRAEKIDPKKFEEDSPLEWYNPSWKVGQVTDVQDLELLVETNHTAETHLIVERYLDRPAKLGHKDNDALKVIGAIESLAKHREIPVTLQTSAQAKGFVKDANIRKLGLWTPGNRHAMDAMRHLLFWLIHGPYRRVEFLDGWRFSD